MHAHGQILRPAGTRHTATAATALRRTAWVNLQLRSTGTRSLGARIGGKLAPRGIGNTLCQRVVFEHPGDAQVLKHNGAELVDQPAAEVVREILATVCNPLVNVHHHLAPLDAFGRPLLSFGQATLRFGKRLFVASKEARIGKLFAGRKRGEMRQANVNANRPLCFRQWRRFGFHAETGEPFTCTGTADGERLNRSLNRTMGDQPDAPDLGQVQPRPVQLETKACLLEGEAVVPAAPLKAGIACFFATLDASKAGVKRPMYPILDIL